MRLSLQQKEQFFHEMRELVRSGQSIPQALQLKTGARFSPVRKVAEAMLSAGGSSNAEGYFAAVPSVFTDMDREIVRGGESSGRLDEAMGYLSDYYGALAKTRRKLIVNTAYPLFILHFGAIALAIPSLMSDGGIEAFVTSILTFLGAFYVSFAVVWFVFNAAVRAARVNPAADQLLQSLPAIGGARIALIGSRFCMLMGILVKSSGSILSAMNRSASASGSALFQRGAQEAVLAVQGGYGLGAAVIRTKAFPEAIDQAFQIGETSGRLDEEMRRQAVTYNEQFQTRLNVLSFWLPQMIYVAIVISMAYRIVEFFKGYYGEMNSLIQ